MRSPIILALSLVTFSFAVRADIAQEAEQHGDIEVKVELDRTAQSGRAERDGENPCEARNRLVPDHELQRGG